MARFQYHARDGQGKLAMGMVAAATLDAARQMLRSEGKFVIKLTPHDEAQAHQEKPANYSCRVRRDEVIVFAHQLAVMVETGVPISEALECAVDQANDPTFKDVLTNVSEQVKAGGELSAVLRQYPRVFPNVMTSLVRAGEISGTLGTLLDRVARYLRKDQHTLRQARGALMYPLFMLLMAVGVTVFLLAFVMPRFAKIYASRKASLPLPTRMLQSMGVALVDYWYAWVLLVVLMCVAWWLARRTPAGRRGLDYIALHAPILRNLYSRLYIARACRTMGTMLSAGVSILDMIPILKQVTPNSFYEDLWDEVDERLRQGSQLSEPLFASPLIPRPVAQMIQSGEKSGRLGQVTLRAAEYAEEEFDQAVKTATRFIEPAVILVMGGIIGFVAISLLLPIFNVGRVMASN